MACVKMVHFKLSPNEEARVLKEERERRRKLRIQQVREQSKLNAAKLRKSVNEEKERLLQELADQLQNQWLREKQQQLLQAEKFYDETVNCVGEGHRQAVDENIEVQREYRELLQQEDWLRAEKRHIVALHRQNELRREQQLEESRQIMARHAALAVERERSSKIASLPPPPHDPLADIERVKLRPVRYTDRDAFATTHYHLTEAVVDKANEEEQEFDAKMLAEVEEERRREIEIEKQRAAHEQVEKARVRHKHALQKESLKQEYSKLLHELSDLQRADVNRRRQQLEKLPKQIFIAPHRRLEDMELQQQNMERAFEDMYLAATDFTGNLNLALDPHPPPLSPVPSESLDATTIPDGNSQTSLLDLPRTVTSFASPPTSDTHQKAALAAHVASSDTSQDSLHPVSVKSSELPSNNKDTEGPLKKLYERIKTQRETWMQKSMHDSTGGDDITTHTPAYGHVTIPVGRDDRADRSHQHHYGGTKPSLGGGDHAAASSPPGYGRAGNRSVAASTSNIGHSDRQPKHVPPPSLLCGTLTDSSPSVIGPSPASLEEGSLSTTTASSYRSLQQQTTSLTPGMPLIPFSMEDSPVVSAECTLPPANLSAILRDEREKRQMMHEQETALYNDVLKQQQHVLFLAQRNRCVRENLLRKRCALREEKQRLEERLMLIETKQRQLEEQDRLISESLSNSSLSSHVHKPSGSFSGAGNSVSYGYPRVGNSSSSQYLSQLHDANSSSRGQLYMPDSLNRDSNPPFHFEAGAQFHSVRTSASLFPQSNPDRVPSDAEREHRSTMASEYFSQSSQDRVQPQQLPGRQQALRDARLNLQEKARQLLLGEVPPTQNFVPRYVPTTGSSAVSHVLSNSLSAPELASSSKAYVPANYLGAGNTLVPLRPSSQAEYPVVMDSFNTAASHSKPEVRSRSVDRWEENVNDVETHHHRRDEDDDDRDFVTPELRCDSRSRAYRPIVFTKPMSSDLSTSPPATTMTLNRFPAGNGQSTELTHLTSSQSPGDEFNMKVLQAQHEFEVRQKRMHEQLAALENEERLLIEEQKRIEQQIGNFRLFPAATAAPAAAAAAVASPTGSQSRTDRRLPRHHHDDFQAGGDCVVAVVEKASDVPLSSSRPTAEHVLPKPSYVPDGELTRSSPTIAATPPDTDARLHRSGTMHDSFTSASSKQSQNSDYDCSPQSSDDEASRDEVRRAGIRLDLFTSSHSDLLGLLADGHLPQLSAPTTPGTSWNSSSYQHLSHAPDSVSSPLDLTTYKLLPDSQSHSSPITTQRSGFSTGREADIGRSPKGGYSEPSDRPSQLLSRKELMPLQLEASRSHGESSNLLAHSDHHLGSVQQQESRNPVREFRVNQPETASSSNSWQAILERYQSDNNELGQTGSRDMQQLSSISTDLSSSSVASQSMQANYPRTARQTASTLTGTTSEEVHSTANRGEQAQHGGSLRDATAEMTGYDDDTPMTVSLSPETSRRPPSSLHSGHLTSFTVSPRMLSRSMFDTTDGGITEEPDLTLVSGTVSHDVSSMTLDQTTTTTPGRSTPSSSLLSFERHERSLLDTTGNSLLSSMAPRRHQPLSVSSVAKGNQNPERPVKPTVISYPPSAAPYLDKPLKDVRTEHENKTAGVRFAIPDEDVGQTLETEQASDILEVSTAAGTVSLMEALAAKRPDFAVRSQQRQAEAKVKAQSSIAVAQAQAENLGKTLASWKKNRAIGGRDNSASKNDPVIPTLIVDTSSDDRKLAQKEMKERTKRLYNQLEEVKQRKASEDRQNAYKLNRERKKEYEKQLSKPKKPASYAK